MNKVAKKYYLVLVLMVVAFYQSHSQTQPAAETLAVRIAQRMKDSLSLNDGQKNQLYAININLYQQKQTVRQQYAGTNLIGTKIQKVENSRDSLYHQVLPEEKYQLYLQKKSRLVTAN